MGNGSHHYFEDGGLELYNIEADISEKHNLSQQKPEKVKELLGLLNDWRNEVNAPIPDQQNPEWGIPPEK